MGKRATLSFLVLSSMAVLSLFGYYSRVHTKVAEMALGVLKKSDSDQFYQEIYAPPNSEKILLGSWQEDEGAVGGHDRSFRHYWDPEKNVGVPWFSYYIIMPYVREGSQAAIPESAFILTARSRLEKYFGGDWRWHYTGALEWARNSAESGDKNNWAGAIDAYSYTPSSRLEAYWRLGHVVHLVADMAEPDHTANVPHAASGFYYPKDLQKISKLIENSHPDIARNPALTKAFNQLRRWLELKSWDEKKTVGYEELIEKNANNIFPHMPSVEKNKRTQLDSYFSTMAQLSLAAIDDPKEFPLPLGVSFLPEKDQYVLLLTDDKQKNWSFFPSIYLSDPTEIEKFVSLARGLLTSAVRLNAGLMEFFHDIVNPPPYVRRVEIRQDNQPRYLAWWEDVTEEKAGRHLADGENTGKISYKDSSYRIVVGRVLKFDEKLPGYLEAGQETVLRIEFGPDPRGFEYPPEKIKSASVKIADETVRGRLTDDGTAWTGRFTPVLDEGEYDKEAKLEITARDVHHHHPSRITFSSQDEVHGDREYLLDSEPEFPAKATPSPPYHWRHYRPGADLTHTVKIRKKGVCTYYQFQIRLTEPGWECEQYIPSKVINAPIPFFYKKCTDDEKDALIIGGRASFSVSFREPGKPLFWGSINDGYIDADFVQHRPSLHLENSKFRYVHDVSPPAILIIEGEFSDDFSFASGRLILRRQEVGEIATAWSSPCVEVKVQEQ